MQREPPAKFLGLDTLPIRTAHQVGTSSKNACLRMGVLHYLCTRLCHLFGFGKVPFR